MLSLTFEDLVRHQGGVLGSEPGVVGGSDFALAICRLAGGSDLHFRR